MCVSAPEAIDNNSCEMKLYQPIKQGYNSPGALYDTCHRCYGWVWP